MKTILVFSDFPLLPTKGFQIFFNKLFQSGKARISDINNPLSANMSISFNHKHEHLQSIVNAEIPIADRHLIMLECPQILPEMHLKKILDNYGHIYAASPYWAKDSSPIIFNYGFNLEMDDSEYKPIELRKFKFGLVQSNKYSCIKGELYTLRREFIIKATKKKLPLALRGSGWDKSIFKVLFDYLKIVRFYSLRLGFKDLILFPKWAATKKAVEGFPVRNKQEFLNDVQVAIIIENSANYVSEKIFDCFRAGTIPIYVGPNLYDFGIPENTVIKSSHDAESVIKIMENIKDYDLLQIQRNGYHFLMNEGQQWSEIEVMDFLAARIIDVI